MTDADDLIAYVQASARVLHLPLDAAQVQRVAAHLVRTKALADTLAAVPLAAHEELAEIFCPAPFPAQDAS